MDRETATGPCTTGTTRRSVLRAVGAGAAVGVPSPSRPLPGRRAARNDPGETITVDGHEIRLEPITGSCRDLFRYLRTRGLSVHGRRTGPAGGATLRAWTVDGEEVVEPATADVSVDEDRYEVERRDADDGGYRLVLADLDVDFGVENYVTVPDWRPADAQTSRECLDAWCDFFERAVHHELGHVRDNLDVAARSDDVVAQWLRRNPPSVRVDPDATADERAAARRILDRQVDRFVVAVLRELHDRAHQRAVEFHADRKRYYEYEFCDACETCADRGQATVADVTAWTLDVEYGYRAHVDFEDGGYHEARHVSSSTFTLERQYGPFDGLLSAVGDLFGVVDGLFGGSDDPVPDVGPGLAYRGDGETTGSYFGELYDPDASETTRTSVSGSVSSDGKVDLYRGDDEYAVSWGPGEYVQGRRVTTGPDGVRSGPAQVPLYTGNWGVMQSRGRYVKDWGVGRSGDYGDPSLGAPRWSIPDCRLVQSRVVSQALYNVGDPATAKRREGLTPVEKGDPVGRETIRWTLTPAGLWDEHRPGRPDCPGIR